MKLKYKKYGAILRPVVSIGVKYRSKSLLCEVLVDSGSDESLLDAGIANILGIELENGEMRKAIGVGGETIVYFVHYIDIEIGGEVYSTEVGFVPRGSVEYGIAGQKGFFNIFKVTFDLKKEEIELRRH